MKFLKCMRETPPLLNKSLEGYGDKISSSKFDLWIDRAPKGTDIESPDQRLISELAEP